MFDFNGHPLASLNVFKYVDTGAVAPIRVDEVKDLSISAILGENITLPETVEVTYNDGRKGSASVAWDSAALEQAISSGVGTYVIEGVVEGGTIVKAHLQIKSENYVLNPSFEDSDRSMWKIIYENGSLPQTDYQQKASDAKSGDYSLHFYSEDEINFKVEQTITGLEPGYYNLSMFLQGGDAENSEVYIYANPNNKEYKMDTSVNGGWGSLDDFYLYRVSDY